MGTRSLICVFYKGRFVIAQYSKWDGVGHGLRILNFLRDSANIERLKDGLQYTITLETREDVEEFLEDMKTPLSDSEISKAWPSLSSDTGYKILEIVTQATAEKRVPVRLSLDFANDKYRFQHIYVIDLDEGVFEVYWGATTKDGVLGERFNGIGPEKYTVPALITSFSFTELPTTTDEFINSVMHEAFYGPLWLHGVCFW
jgi:hypothetical protein